MLRAKTSNRQKKNIREFSHCVLPAKYNLRGTTGGRADLQIYIEALVIFKDRARIRTIPLLQICPHLYCYLDQPRRSSPPLQIVPNYGTFAPTYFRSRELKLNRWNFRSLEPLVHGTFIPWNFRSHEPKSPGTFAPQHELSVI